MNEINWPVVLRNIEREFDGLPPEPSATQVLVRRSAARLALQRSEEWAERLGAAARVILILALIGGMAVWPYPRDCGWGIFAYVSAQVVIVVGGFWIFVWTWSHRMAKTHAISLALVVSGCALIVAQVLPRMGYSGAEPRHPPHWRCEARR